MTPTPDDRQRCRRLRSKQMYVDVAPDPDDPGARMPNTGDGFCWCTHTMNCLGPDGQVADSKNCRAGRHCFEPL
ncbi:MAG: hypothetical protein ACE5IK_08770 [Acidobacteriota bacterium]